MAAANFLKACYLSYFSKPASDRILFRVIQKHKVQRILELGIGIGQRAVRMIEMAERQSGEQVSYTGTDPFETRTSADGPGLVLKSAHQVLRATGARVRLIPGDAFSALSRTANALADIDLVVISARQDPRTLSQAMFYLPRVLHAGSHVFREETQPDGSTVLHRLSAAEIANLAQGERARRVA